MLQAVIIVAVALIATGALLKGYSLFLRWRALATLDRDAVIRLDRGVTMRVLLHRTRAFRGMNPARANRTRGDLALTSERFLVTSGRGVLVDLGPDRGRRFTSARCTGPGRLVLEGDVPGPKGQLGLYRFEIQVQDAVAWAEALAPFVRPSEDGAPRYAVKPPDR